MMWPKRTLMQLSSRVFSTMALSHAWLSKVRMSWVRGVLRV